MEPVTITLKPFEVLQAAHAGVMRQVQNIKKKRKPTFGIRRDYIWQAHVIGAIGECVLAKYLNVYWSGKGIFRGDDVDCWDVRLRSEHHYDLMLHQEDEDDRFYWHITGGYSVNKIWGFIEGKDGKRQEYWGDKHNTGRPCYWVPNEALLPPDQYPKYAEIIHERKGRKEASQAGLW